ncbi:hypothetical protein [Streptomyces celluloflavus]|uniref:hypothetical protein n=1 Tax=Streptomyces celluloflavus TaxID=58344 RepID=UPI0036BBEE80
MAEWKAPLPGTDVKAGDDGHPTMHNQVVAAILECRTNVDGIPAGPSGPAGPKGADGKDGKPGEKGANGTPGKDGAAGPAGKDGATTAAALTVAAIDGVEGTTAQAVLENLAKRLAALESKAGA